MDITAAFDSRVIIVEGISGSGKDTFQAYLKEKLNGRNVYDYSEGDLLHSWKHSPIEGISNLRVKLLKLFVNYVRDVVRVDENAVFLLNRFHLSMYVTTVTRQPQLEGEYNRAVKVLRTLPVHIFLLRLHEHEIEQRSMHAERSGTWQRYQRGRVEKDGFRDRAERYIWQQRLMLETAKSQRIPYSIIRVPHGVGGGRLDVPEARSIPARDARTALLMQKPPRGRRHVLRSF